MYAWEWNEANDNFQLPAPLSNYYTVGMVWWWLNLNKHQDGDIKSTYDTRSVTLERGATSNLSCKKAVRRKCLQSGNTRTQRMLTWSKNGNAPKRFHQLTKQSSALHLKARPSPLHDQQIRHNYSWYDRCILQDSSYLAGSEIIQRVHVWFHFGKSS